VSVADGFEDWRRRVKSIKGHFGSNRVTNCDVRPGIKPVSNYIILSEYPQADYSGLLGCMITEMSSDFAGPF
jgi:hypothetical protein